MSGTGKKKGPAIVNASGPAGVPKLLSTLPSDTVNALPTIAQALVDDPTEQHWAIVVLDNAKSLQDTDTGMVVPHVRVRKLEVIFSPADVETARVLLKRASEARLGKVPLDGFDEAMELDRETRFPGDDLEDPDATL
jgi:hypothetical protein